MEPRSKKNKLTKKKRSKKNKDYETPARKPVTRSSVLKTPGAPRKPLFDVDDPEYKIDRYKVDDELIRLQENFSKMWLHEEKVKPLETILERLKTYRDKYRKTSFPYDDLVEDDDTDVLQVEDISPDDVKQIIAELLSAAPEYGFPVPSRADDCLKFSSTVEAWILKRKREFCRKGADCARYNITHALLTKIYMLCTREKHMEPREIQYSDKNLYQHVDNVNHAVNDVCCMMRCTRSSLNISASENGLVYGDMYFRFNGEDYDCRSGPTAGVAIPPNSNSITDIRSREDKELYFVILVEKHTVFQRLWEDGFCEKYHCVMITGKGYPTVETRIFLRKVSFELQLPVFALVDGNPHGLRIYSVYRYGSKTMSYDRLNLVTPNIQFLGVRFKDIDWFKIPEKYIEDMSDNDIKIANNLKDQYHLKDHHNDLQSMIDENKKVQIEALYLDDVDYFAAVALPIMLQEKLTELELVPIMLEEKLNELGEKLTELELGK